MLENASSPLRFKTFWLVIGWSLIIAVIVLSLMPHPPPMQSFNHGDKIGHFMVYLVLMGWFAQIYHVPRQRLQYMIGFLLLGGLLEILQSLTGTRYPNWFDMLANSLGVLLAWQLTKNRFANILIHFEQKFL